MLRKKSSTPRTPSALRSNLHNPNDVPPHHGCGPERLVGLGFRYWIFGRQSGDMAAWERAWTLYSGMFGFCGAQVAIGALACWAGAVHRSARRAIELQPLDSPGFCADECIAVSMIAACQNRACPAARACAYGLTGQSAVDRMVDEAQAFADAMSALEQRLSPNAIVTVPLKIDPCARAN